MTVQSLLGSVPKFGVGVEQTFQKYQTSLSILANNLLLIQFNFALFIFGQSLLIIPPFERVKPQQQHMRNNTKTKQVTFKSIRLHLIPPIRKYLRRHVTHRPTSSIMFNLHIFTNIQRQPKIYDFNFLQTIINYYVLRFYIPVNDIAGVTVLQTI